MVILISVVSWTRRGATPSFAAFHWIRR